VYRLDAELTSAISKVVDDVQRLLDEGVSRCASTAHAITDRAGALAAAPRGRPLTSSPARTGWPVRRGDQSSCAPSRFLSWG
jgi:hypothetical protein